VAPALGQVTAPTSGSPATLVCYVPPGSTCILSSVENNADVFLGFNTAVTSATGFPLDNAGPTVFTNPAQAPGFTFYAVAGTGTHIVGYMVIPFR
jgi:hypothetical protein